MKYIFGPVPSRRLGWSLGVDILNGKTCNMNCIYCEVGPTKNTVNSFVSVPFWKDIMHELEQVIKEGDRPIDCITFTASGEPTLHKNLYDMVKKTKELTSVPVMVLTNSSLVNESNVLKALCMADVVLPSLDAASQDCFKCINRPHPDLSIDNMIKGLKQLKIKMKGKMWLEILFVRGVNDSNEELERLKAAVSYIQPDKIQLNTVVRPPAKDGIRPVSKRWMHKIKEFFGNSAEIIADFRTKTSSGAKMILESELIDTLVRRPLTVDDLVKSFGNTEEVRKIVDRLISTGNIKKEKVGEKTYLCIKRQG